MAHPTIPSRLLLILFVLPLSGCLVARTSLNEPIDPARVARLHPGMTGDEVVAELGAPTEVVQLGLRSAYRFDHVKKKRTGLWLLLVGLYNEDTREDRVWAFFDENDRLTHVGATLQADDAQYAMPWSRLHHD